MGQDSGKIISALSDVARAASAAPALEEVYRAVHRALAGVCSMDRCFIACLSFDGQIHFPYLSGKNSKGVEEQIRSLVRQVAASGRSMMFHEPDMPALAGQKTPGPVSAVWAAAPLMINGRVDGVVGGLGLGSDLAEKADGLGLLESLAGFLAQAIERDRAVTRIRHQEAWLENILESSPVGMALVENRVFKRVNRAMVRMFGYTSKADFLNRNVEMIYGAAEAFELAGKTVFQALSEKGTAEYETRLVKRDDSWFPVHVRLNSAGWNNSVLRTIAVFTDISSRRSGEKLRVEGERFQGVLEMAGAICHEINQPLQTILGYAELLAMNPDAKFFSDGLRSIKSQAVRLGKLTSSLANINQYKTLEYPGEKRIVDIWGAGPPKIK